MAPEVQVNQDDDEGLWPRRDTVETVLHGAAFPDPAFHAEAEPVYTVRYVGATEEDARGYLAVQAIRPGAAPGVYVRATRTVEVERSDWEAVDG